MDAARLILVEGMIGSGKTTTALRIGDYLAGRGENARVFREAAVDHPGRGPAARLRPLRRRFRRVRGRPVAPLFGPPKSRAGHRVVDFADLIVPRPEQASCRAFPPGGQLAFTSPEGSALSNTTSGGGSGLLRSAVGLVGVHIHDLRHAGNEFTAKRRDPETMVRMDMTVRAPR